MTETLPQATQPMFKVMIEHLTEIEKRIRNYTWRSRAA